MAITIIVEDGTGIEDANSYITTDFASTYFDLQGSSLWCDNTDLQNLALVQASTFFDLRYSNRFCGNLVNADQGLLFPRNVLINGPQFNYEFGIESPTYVNTGIPKQLQNAVAALVLLFLTDGGLDLNANVSGSNIKAQSVAIGNGAVEQSTTYYDKPETTTLSLFSTTDRYVNQLMKNIGCESGKQAAMFIEAYRG